MQTELPPIVDDSWFQSRTADSIERAARTADRRPSPRAMARTRPFRRRSPWRHVVSAAWLAAATAVTIAAAMSGQQPRLVGYGCEGFTAPIYAAEESDFPPCRAIERAH